MVWEYEVPTVPFGREGVVIVSEGCCDPPPQRESAAIPTMDVKRTANLEIDDLNLTAARCSGVDRTRALRIGIPPAMPLNLGTPAAYYCEKRSLNRSSAMNFFLVTAYRAVFRWISAV